VSELLCARVGSLSEHWNDVGHQLGKASLAKLVGERSRAPGVGYFGSGAVTDLVRTRDAIIRRSGIS
jgi:hypothetical protein